MLDGAHMCFIAAGLGGGTGSGAAPVIAKAAHDRGILTVGVVTTPFGFEGKRRARTAALGLDELRQHVDTLIVVPNQNLFRIANPETTIKAAFALADEVLQKGVRGITDLITTPGLINLDFADIRSIMTHKGGAMLGVGEASGDNRAACAAEQAISNPLLDERVRGARGVIISITGSDDMRLWEIDEIAGYIKEQIDPNAEIIWGSAFEESLMGTIRVSVVATGIELPTDPRETAFYPLGPPDGRQDALHGPTKARASSVLKRYSSSPDPDTLPPSGESRTLLIPPQGSTEIATLEPCVGVGPAPGLTLFERLVLLSPGAEVPEVEGRGVPRLNKAPHRPVRTSHIGAGCLLAEAT
jgi:cell division protein FtsZ